MCDCVIMGDVKIMNGDIYINNEKIENIPNELREKIYIGQLDYKINKKGNRVINGYEFENGKFSKTIGEVLKSKI